jgi:putative molybdopterin biosynthesis protein
VRSAALALGLDFISVGWERYDLAIPAAHLEHSGVQHLIAVLNSAEFQRALGAQPGYDVRETGKVQAEFSL